MNLRIGIVGLPNVGKSTIFNALTNNNVLAANYPFATIEPNTGVVAVPDKRLNELQKIYQTAKIIPASVTFIDIAGLVAGASQGEGLGNKFLANIRECQAIAHIVRAFKDDNVVHTASTVDPLRDIGTVNTELMLADIQTLQNRLSKLSKELKANPKAKPTYDYLNKLVEQLDGGTMLNQLPELDLDLVADLQLLTAKPTIYVFNVDEATLTDEELKVGLKKLVEPQTALFICAKLEDELKGLSEDESQEILDSYGVKEYGLSQLIHAAYQVLGLQSFLTAGPKEVRAWTIQQGWSAPQAAGTIHTDFEKGFIAAQVVDYDDLISAGSEVAAKTAGKVRTEGRDYIMRPGDVVEFRFNVSK